MNDDVLGLNHLLSFDATLHTVRPPSSAVSCGHLRMAPPKSSSVNPKFFRYQSASAELSPVLLKNTPPIPVIFAIVPVLLVQTNVARTFGREAARARDPCRENAVRPRQLTS